MLARRPQTQKPSSRAVLLLVCLCYQTFCLRYHILSCCYKLSRLLCYQNLSPAATKNCPSYQFFAATILLVTRLSLLSWTAQNLPSLPDPLSRLLLNFTSFSLLVCPCYQTSVAVPDSPESALVTRFSLGLLQTVHVTSFSPLLICPCYQIFAAVLDSPESAHVTRFPLQLLRSLGPRPSPFRLVLCLSQTFSFVSLTDMLLWSLGPGPSPFRLPSHDGINVDLATL